MVLIYPQVMPNLFLFWHRVATKAKSPIKALTQITKSFSSNQAFRFGSPTIFGESPFILNGV
jgi:hypothetical protein